MTNCPQHWHRKASAADWKNSSSSNWKPSLQDEEQSSEKLTSFSSYSRWSWEYWLFSLETSCPLPVAPSSTADNCIKLQPHIQDLRCLVSYTCDCLCWKEICFWEVQECSVFPDPVEDGLPCWACKRKLCIVTCPSAQPPVPVQIHSSSHWSCSLACTTLSCSGLRMLYRYSSLKAESVSSKKPGPTCWTQSF